MKLHTDTRGAWKQPFSSPAAGLDALFPYRQTEERQQAGQPDGRWPASFQSLLVRKMIEVQESERRRIAREIHDGTEQLLGNAIFHLDMCVMQYPGMAKGAAKQLEKVRTILIQTVEDLQNVSHSLRPSLLDDLGLEASLSWLFDASGVKDRLNLRWRVSGVDGRLPSGVETALFRIVQEASSNALKHARAKNLRVGVRVNERRAIAIISDDGVGFDAEAWPCRHGTGDGSIHMGLSGMKERVELLGGRLILSSYPRKGTRVVAVIPLSSG